VLILGNVAAEPAEQNAVWSNPLYGDPALFEIYLSMLDEVIDNPEKAARRHLANVRYLQTTTSGWSGSLAFAGAGGQYSRATAQAEQPLSYPEIVAEFRGFARDVAAELYRGGARVFVGIDELDKIGAPEQAERFLNEIKGIFGIPHLYFMVSVSDDALTSFERRGLPLRDAFDSSFDEIIQVGPLSYTESRRLLYRRVIGLTEPYVAFSHCLAGGLARDLIRAARQIGRTSETFAGDSGPETAEPSWVDADLIFASRLLRDTAPRQTLTLSTICAAVVREEIRRKARAVARAAISAAPGHGQELQDTLNHIARNLAAGEPALKIVDVVSQPAGPIPLPVSASISPPTPTTAPPFRKCSLTSLTRCVSSRRPMPPVLTEPSMRWPRPGMPSPSTPRLPGAPSRDSGRHGRWRLGSRWGRRGRRTSESCQVIVIIWP
jgi:hypothetical protein